MDHVAPVRVSPEAAGRGRREIGFGLSLLVAGLVIGIAAGPASSSIGHLAGDKLFWSASRLTAFLAYLSFAASVCYGIGMSSGILDALAGRFVSFTLHRDLAIAGLAFTAAHVFLLLGDSYIGFDLTTLLVPGQSPYRPLPIAVGQVCAWAAAATVVSFYLRSRMGTTLWRSLHSFSAIVFVLATIHGLFAGSDSRLDVIWWMYVGIALLVLFLTVYRIAMRGQRKPPVPRVDAGD
jgi:sulfoxide reductase heme-binding subunit YedZ